MGSKINVEGLSQFRWWKLEKVWSPEGAKFECRIKPTKSSAVVSTIRADVGDAVRFAILKAGESVAEEVSLSPQRAPVVSI